MSRRSWCCAPDQRRPAPSSSGSGWTGGSRQLKRARAGEQERERALEKLKQSERRLAEAQQVAHIGSWERDLRTNQVTWSDELYRLFGLQAHEGDLSYQQFLNLVLPQDVDRIRVLVDEAIRERRGFSCDYRITRADGSVRVLHDRGSVILNEEGEPIRLVGTAQDVTELRQAEQALQEYAARLQALSRRLLEVQEAERRHLARELHDEFGQVLAAITLHLHAARGLAGEAALPRLDECATLLQQAGEQVRSLALELRPTMLDTLGLEATLRWLAEQHQQRTGCEVQVVGHLSGAPPSPDMAIACFRVAQEALTNVVRHAAARHVWIELSQSESVLELVVRDDGVGFEVAPAQEQAARRGSLGLLGMAERVQLLGGALQVESEPGRGDPHPCLLPPGRGPRGSGRSGGIERQVDQRAGSPPRPAPVPLGVRVGAMSRISDFHGPVDRLSLVRASRGGGPLQALHPARGAGSALPTRARRWPHPEQKRRPSPCSFRPPPWFFRPPPRSFPECFSGLRVL